MAVFSIAKDIGTCLVLQASVSLGFSGVIPWFVPSTGCNVAECFHTANDSLFFVSVLYQRCYLWYCNFINLKAEGLEFDSLPSLSMWIEVYKLDSIS